MHKFEQEKNWNEIAEKNSKNLKRYKGIIKSSAEILKNGKQRGLRVLKQVL
jgi:hypothetical protein